MNDIAKFMWFVSRHSAEKPKENMWSYVANLNETDLMKLPISIQLKIFFYEWENI